ncbi:MAG: hypothetical protein J7K31_03870 [Candidatus Aenigmarchaeota archaeon]|nr:hypothetical protein [Candidatus Aenigmarchaeota archaeon]
MPIGRGRMGGFDLDWARVENVFALAVAIKCHINEEFLVISRNVRSAEP